MIIIVDEELKRIAESIEAMKLGPEVWAEHESDDEYQTVNYCGGYDKDEEAFCFSLFHPDGNEYWFQFTLDQAKEIITGQLKEIPAQKAE